MNNKITKILLFTLGAAIGSPITWKLVKNKYEKMAITEIDAIRKYYFEKIDEMAERENESIETMETLKEQVSALGYSSNEEKESSEEKEDEQMLKDRPYVISPDDFGEEDDYEIESLNYYADGVLTDDWDNIIGNVDDIVGEESLEHFGEYETDTVFVRNDRLRTYFEVMRDLRRYEDLPRDDKSSEEE